MGIPPFCYGVPTLYREHRALEYGHKEVYPWVPSLYLAHGFLHGGHSEVHHLVHSPWRARDTRRFSLGAFSKACALYP